MLGLPSPALYIGGALLVLLVTSGSLNACQHRTIGELRTDLGATRAKLDTAVSANTSQSEAIGKLEAAIREWEALTLTPSEITSRLASLAEYERSIQSLSAELSKVKSHAPPQCRALLDADFGAVCPDISQRLRQRAQGGGARPDR